MTDASTLLVLSLGSCVVVPWLICRALPLPDRPVDTTKPILRNRYEGLSDQFSNGDKGLGASASRPGTRPTGHAAFGVDGASRFGPSRGVASDSSFHSPGAIP